MENPTYRNDAYWFGEEGPFCSACWDIDQNKVRLHKLIGGWAECPAGKGHSNAKAFPEEAGSEEAREYW